LYEWAESTCSALAFSPFTPRLFLYLPYWVVLPGPLPLTAYVLASTSERLMFIAMQAKVICTAVRVNPMYRVLLRR